jgi:hypothetical protein
MQAPELHASPVVQPLPSSQDVPFGVLKKAGLLVGLTGTPPNRNWTR